MSIPVANVVKRDGWKLYMFKTEEELVERLSKHYCRYFVVKELGVGYGVSDLLIIRNKSELERFIQIRNGKYLKFTDEVKIFDYIRRRRNGVYFNELLNNSFISKSKLRYTILRRLMEIGAIYLDDNQYHRNPNFNLFTPITTAIEAKLEDWNKGLAQAIRYQRFAQKSYLALDERYIHRIDKSQFIKFNVGLISVGSKVKEVIRPLEKQPLDPIMRYKISEEIIARINFTSETH